MRDVAHAVRLGRVSLPCPSLFLFPFLIKNYHFPNFVKKMSEKSECAHLWGNFYFIK